MTLVAALPLRGGMVNLGGDGQLVIGGLVAALVPLYLPAPGPVAAAAAILAAMLASGLYASLAAWGESPIRHPHADLESPALLSGGRRRFLYRWLSASRHHDRPCRRPS